MKNTESKTMAISDMQNLEKLDQEDQSKVSYFIQLLLQNAKYQALHREIAHRRKEIAQGNTLTHEALWEQLHV